MANMMAFWVGWPARLQSHVSILAWNAEAAALLMLLPE